MHRVQTVPLAGAPRHALGLADRLTLARAVLGLGAVGLVAVGDLPVPLLASLLAVALSLDWLDGRVARRTGTASAFGARLDMEVDALLILALSLLVASRAGWWVLALGLARYAFAGLVWLMPALQFDPPPRSWCKVVAAVVAVVLAGSAVELFPAAWERAALLVVAALLLESFAHEAVDRWRVGARARVVYMMLGGSRG